MSSSCCTTSTPGSPPTGPTARSAGWAAVSCTLAQCSAQVVAILERCAALEAETDGYFSAYAGGCLDPSGLVKGWAIEAASDLLVAAGSTSHCVNGGGDVQCVGDSAPGVPWRVGIAHPLRAGELATVVTGTDIAVATSGPAERGPHVLDPHQRPGPGRAGQPDCHRPATVRRRRLCDRGVRDGRRRPRLAERPARLLGVRGRARRHDLDHRRPDLAAATAAAAAG